MAKIKRKDLIMILQFSFKILSLALLSFIILESLWTNSVLGYLNLNFLLLIWLAVGILVLVVKNNN